MKKTLLALSILATFVLAGCGGETKSSTDSKTPEAKPAVKIEEKKVEYNENGEKVYKMGTPKKSFADFEKGKSNEGLHKFKTNK